MLGTKIEKPVIQQPGSLTWGFRLGDKVKDKINDLEGIAIGRLFHMTGCDRFSIELPAADGKPGEVYHVDGNRLELVTAYEDRHRADEAPLDLHVKLGDEAKSMIHGLVGTATVVNVPLYGAIQVCLDPKWDPKEKKLPDGFFVDANFIEVIKPYSPRPKVEQQPTEAAKKTRGPVRLGRNYSPR